MGNKYFGSLPNPSDFMLRKDRHASHRSFEQTGADLDILRIREKPLLRLTIRKAQQKQAVDLVIRLALQSPRDFEVESEYAGFGLEQRRDLGTVLGIYGRI